MGRIGIDTEGTGRGPTGGRIGPKMTIRGAATAGHRARRARRADAEGRPAEARPAEARPGQRQADLMEALCLVGGDHPQANADQAARG